MFEKPSVLFSLLTSNLIPSSSRSLSKSFIYSVKLILSLLGLQEMLNTAMRLMPSMSSGAAPQNLNILMYAQFLVNLHWALVELRCLKPREMVLCH